MAKIAERYYIGRNVGAALRTRVNMMCVKNAVRIAVSITADLALIAVASLNKSRKPFPMSARIVVHAQSPLTLVYSPQRAIPGRSLTNLLFSICLIISGNFALRSINSRSHATSFLPTSAIPSFAALL
jgi:hypothetical protein